MRPSKKARAGDAADMNFEGYHPGVMYRSDQPLPHKD